MISGEDVTLIIRTDIIPKLPSRMFFTSCHGRFVFTTTDGWKNNPHGCFKTSVWGNVRQGILYLVMIWVGMDAGGCVTYARIWGNGELVHVNTCM